MPIQIINFDTGGGGGAGGVVAAFVHADLAAGIYAFAHSLGSQYPTIVVYNNNDLIVDPDDITAVNTNTASIDVSSWGTIAGTWHVRGVA